MYTERGYSERYRYLDAIGLITHRDITTLDGDSPIYMCRTPSYLSYTFLKLPNGKYRYICPSDLTTNLTSDRLNYLISTELSLEDAMVDALSNFQQLFISNGAPKDVDPTLAFSNGTHSIVTVPIDTVESDLIRRFRLNMIIKLNDHNTVRIPLKHVPL